ncbi:MAG: hypothetical protein R3E89_01250 [Thiolinea sp.]
MSAYLPEVLAFAELGDFAAEPVRTWSSGMVVRLVFAVAAVMEPDVVIVDEALAVGDAYFQKKSLDRMRSILAGGASLVFCSHNLYQVREMCEQALWLEQGRIRMLGTAQQVVDAYQDAVQAGAFCTNCTGWCRASRCCGQTHNGCTRERIYHAHAAGSEFAGRAAGCGYSLVCYASALCCAGRRRLRRCRGDGCACRYRDPAQ